MNAEPITFYWTIAASGFPGAANTPLGIGNTPSQALADLRAKLGETHAGLVAVLTAIDAEQGLQRER